MSALGSSPPPVVAAPHPATAVAADSPAKRLTVESALQVVIMLAIGAAAAAASFTHAHDVAAAHGQAGWLAWADAVVLELMSVASGLEMRRRKRIGSSVKSPAIVLVIAVALSLSAQVVEAEASPIGWIAAAIPALGFLVMVKVALAQTAPSPAGVFPPRSAVVPEGHPDRKVQTVKTSTGNPPVVVAGSQHQAAPYSSAKSSAVPICSSKESADGSKGTRVDSVVDPVVLALAPAARTAASRLDDQGRRLSRHALADALREEGHGISNARASALLKTLKAERGVSPVSPARGRSSRPKPSARPAPDREPVARSVTQSALFAVRTNPINADVVPGSG